MQNKEKKNFKQFLLIMMILVSLFSAFILYYVTSVQSLVIEDSKDRMWKLNYQLNINFNTMISEHEANVKNAFDKVNINNMYEVTKVLAELKKQYKLKDIAFFSGNKAYNESYKNVNIPSALKKKVNSKKVYVAEPEKLNKNYYVTYGIPVFQNGKYIGGVCFSQKADEVKGILNNAGYEKDSKVIIVNKTGDVLFESSKKTELYSVDELKFYIHNKLDDILIKQPTSSVFDVNISDEKLFVTYHKIENTEDWYAFSCVPSSTIMANGNSIVSQTIFVTGILLSGLLLLFVFTYYQQKRYDRRMLKFSYEDKLTGLSSYLKFDEDVNYLLKHNTHKQYALIFFDINKFKAINETYGYEVGDELLKQIGKAIEESISEKALCCRMSNDYFLIFDEYHGNKMDVIRTMSLIEGKIKDIKINDKNTLTCFISTGVYIFENEDIYEYKDNLTKYISRAKMAHSAVKGKHDVRIRFFDDKIKAEFTEERNIENEMDQALETNQFEVYYQPKYDIHTQQVVGCEALVRWKHPTKGILSPSQFIPLFEKNGFIIQIDCLMFERACQDLREWLDKGIEPVKISVNLSRIHIRSGDMISMLKNTMRKYHIDPKYLEIELTESIANDDMNQLKEIVKNIKKLGLTISIDDFGSGYSSLSLLEAIDFDVLKLDKSFIFNLDSSEKSKKVLTHVIALAKDIDVVVLCEGVESLEQAKYLESIGCDVIQGFLYSKPLRKQEFEMLLEHIYENK